MHQALYRKWRPQNFDDVVGQEHITSVLKYEAQQGKLNHAYLFCGSRGTGKTTCAKILARVVNCESPINGNPCGKCMACRAIEEGKTTDIIEMDAASNNGVDNIRDIRDEVAYTPSLLKYRVYIIDEVHMLSSSAFNALLKTLEEPPEHVVFILATTEMQKLPATIISRCQRFEFRRIAISNLVKRLQYIANQENIQITEEAAFTLAKLAQGGMRDAISLLELCAGKQTVINQEIVEDTVGILGRGFLLQMIDGVIRKDYDFLFAKMDEIVKSSKDILVFWQDFIAIYRDLLVLKTTSQAAKYLDLTDSEIKQMQEVSSKLTKSQLLYHCKMLEDALFNMQKSNAVKRMIAELTLVQMCDDTLNTTKEAMLSRINKLEEGLYSASVTPMVKPVEKPVEKPSVVEEKPQVKVEEKVNTFVKPIEKVEPKPMGNKRILRPLRSWPDVIERILMQNPMSGGCYKTARAYTTEDQRIVIKFTSKIMADICLKGNGLEQLRVCISTVIKRTINESDILIELEEKKDELDKFDEIIDEIEGEEQ